MRTAAKLSTVFVAGIGNSEPGHWQSIWARTTPRSVWVEQRDWENPVRDDWVNALETTLSATSGPKVLVAHSLGCLVIAAAAEACSKLGVLGAFLVSVPDVHGPNFPPSAAGFPAARATRLAFPSIVVASSDDPYGTLVHAEHAAKHWRSELVCVGAKGHINLKSDLGDWREGRDLLDRFTLSLTAACAS